MLSDYLERGLWGQETMVSLLRARLRASPDGLAVSDGAHRLSWSGLAAAAGAAARAFRRMGLVRGDRVVVQLPNWVENIVLRYALKLAGLVGVYAPVTWRENEMRQLLSLTGARATVMPRSFHKSDFGALIRRLRSQAPTLTRAIFVRGLPFEAGWITRWEDLVQDTAGLGEAAEAAGESDNSFAPWEVSLICVSSGSTGAPKLCESPEAAQLANGRAMAAQLSISADDVVGVLAPLEGGAGLMGWLIAVAAGAPVVVTESLRAEQMLDVLASERVSLVATVPALLLRILAVPDLERWDLTALRLIRTGSAALPPPTAAEAERRLRAKMVPAAGTMEVLTFAQTRPDDPPELRVGGSVGRPLPNNEVRVVGEEGAPLPAGEIGVIEVRGAGTGSGYLGDPEATLAAWKVLGPDGWFRTGDLGCIDERGYVHIKGRLKDVVLRGGRNVFPAEIESLLVEHPAVREAAVVGAPCPRLGEKTLAFIVPKTGAGLAETDIVAFLEHKQIAGYKIPDEIHFLSELPRLPSAKVNRRALKERGSSTASRMEV